MTRADWTALSLILILALFHAALLGGVFRGEDAIRVPASFDLRSLPEGTAPTIREPSAAELAEADDSPGLPGRFVPTQGKFHSGVWPGDRVSYCPEGQVRDDCYASLPPSSGLHAPVQRAVRLADGSVTPLPPNPGVYAFDLPRETVSHIQEHAGVFVGYNCEDGNQECRDIVEELTGLVNSRIDNNADRVVMSNDPDLPENSIGLSAWTRVLNMPIAEWDKGEVADFIGTHSCRYDPEEFCG